MLIKVSARDRARIIMGYKIVLSFLATAMFVTGCSRDDDSNLHGMKSHVSADYLALCLEKEKTIGDLTLREQRIGELRLPTGRLVASDAFVFTEPQAFELPMPSGVFPVVLSIAQFSNDQRVAFATIRFRDSVPVAWRMLTVKGQDTNKLQNGEIFGYGVDSGTGCFIDASAGKLLDQKMRSEPKFYEEMISAMDRKHVDTWSWLDMPFGDGNLVAFSSGFGDGGYATYVGFDAEGRTAVVVTDFSVAPMEEETGD